MPISLERFDDRLEFLRAFLAMKGAVQTIAFKANLKDDQDVVEVLSELNTLMEAMVKKLERDRG